MKLLRIKDNTRTIKAEFSKIKNLRDKITDKTLKTLEKEGILIFPKLEENTSELTKEQIVLETIDNRLRSNNVMGFLGYNDERLIIESRFSSNNKDYFFQYLLNHVLDYLNIVDLKSDANHDKNLLDLLLLMFPYYLKIAMRKGLFKCYIQNQYNDANVKGTIDIPRHIKYNTPFIGNIAYNLRELSYDNYLTELIRHTIEFIKRNPAGNSLLSKVKEEIKDIIEVTPNYKIHDRQKIINVNKNKPISHAYYREYLSLQRLCLLILQYDKCQIGYGTHPIYGILFDGAWLWEEYVNSLIKGNFYHPMNRSKEGTQYLFSDFSGRKIGKIYPDFISRENENRIIADAKYKPIGNIRELDYQQLLAYMFRFDSKTGLYLYPEAKGSKDKKLWLNRGTTFENNVLPRNDIYVIKHGLEIPKNVVDYDDFAEKMKGFEKEFLDSLEQLLKEAET